MKGDHQIHNEKEINFKTIGKSIDFECNNGKLILRTIKDNKLVLIVFGIIYQDIAHWSL